MISIPLIPTANELRSTSGQAVGKEVFVGSFGIVGMWRSMTAKKKRKMKKEESPISTFATYEEEAAFWDTHDLADYWDEFKLVKVRFAKKLSHLSETLNIRLDPEDVVKLRQEAHKKGIGPTTLVRMWVREHLHGNKQAA